MKTIFVAQNGCMGFKVIVVGQSVGNDRQGSYLFPYFNPHNTHSLAVIFAGVG